MQYGFLREIRHAVRCNSGIQGLEILGTLYKSEILRRVGVLYEEDRRAALEKHLADYHF